MPNSYQPERLRVLDAQVDLVNMNQALDFVDHYLKNAASPGFILAVNPEKVYALRDNPFLRDFFNAATLLIPDGIGMVLALRFLWGRKISRVPGADLMQNLCAKSAAKGHRLFLYGATEEVNSGAAEELRHRYPNINIVGRANGYVTDMNALIEDINSSGAEILFVALGSPRQEQWVHRHIHLLNVKLIQCIGGTLDTITGRVKRAPKVFQAAGLEWFYRLLCEPSRVRRQKRLPIFVWEIIKAKLSLLWGPS